MERRPIPHNAGGDLVGKFGCLDEIAQPDFLRVKTDAVGGHIHEALHHKGGDRPSDTAIRTQWSLGSSNPLHPAAIVLDAIRARQKAHHLHRLERRRPGIDRIGTDVADDVRTQSHGMAVLIEPELGIDDFIEPLTGRLEVFQPVACPFHASPQLDRSRTDENFFRIERAFGAEPAADIGSHHAQSMTRDVERGGKRIAYDARNLRGRIKGQGRAARVVLSEAGARFNCERRLSVHAKPTLHAHRCGFHHRIHIATLELPVQEYVRAGLFMQERRTGLGRLLRVDDRWERLKINDDARDCVLRLVAALGQYRRHGLADMANLAASERKDRSCVIPSHPRGGVERLDQSVEIIGGEHRGDARRGKRFRTVDGADPRMGMITATKSDMQYARNLAIIDIAAQAPEQARIFDSLDARPDDFRPQMGLLRVSHERNFHICWGWAILFHGRGCGLSSGNEHPDIAIHDFHQ